MLRLHNSKIDLIDLTIDINAWIPLNKRQDSHDGIEMIFAVNHNACFLLTNLLLEYLKASVGHQVRGVLRIVRWVIFNVFRAITPQEGAQTSIYLASSPEVEGVTGKYFSKQKLKASYDREAWQRLWKVSEELTGLAS